MEHKTHEHGEKEHAKEHHGVEHHEKSEHKAEHKVVHHRKKNYYTQKNLTIAAIVVLALLVAGSFTYKYKKATISPDEAKSKVVSFIKDNLVQPGTKVEVKEITKEGQLYKVVLDVQGQEITTYETTDGKKFFPQVIDMEKDTKQAATSQEQKEIPKTEKPKVDLYVMSFCPFGNKAEDTLKPVYELLKNKVEFNFHYIVSSKGDSIDSLHGEPEVIQNEREACVMKLYGKDQWLNFATYVNTNCGTKGECWEAGAKSLKIDVARVNSCVKSDGVKLMKADEEKSKAANAQGSPTMLINGVSANAVYQYGNSEAYKKAICDAFATAPSECSKTLSSETSTTQGGSCN